MKTLWSLLVLFIALGIVSFLLGRTGKPESQINKEIDLSPEVNSTQLCYIWNTEAGDRALLSMDLRGENVIGEFYWLPMAKDAKTGIFKGTVTPVDQTTMSRTVSAWWEARAEGTTVTEELKIIFGEGIANVGFGEMKDRGDGVYVYADPTKLSYVPNLQQAECGNDQNAID